MTIFLPYIIAFLAVSTFGLLSPMVKKLGVDFPPFSFIAISSLILGGISSFVAYFFEKEKLLAALEQVNINWLVIFSLTNLVGAIGYIWAIQRVPVVHYEMLLFISPIIGGIFAFYLLDEAFHVRYLLALVFMVAGLAIAIRPWDLK